ncbi:MAG: hypothetical protein HRU09_02735 [Oligoflexales bacterium]|nr:hypothetical protein [Oligoflexales bacterium]
MSQEVSDVIVALRKKLEDYREKRPHLSIRAIAKRSNVNRYFLSKILSDEESKASSLDFSQVLLLAKFLTASDTLKETIDNSSEEIRDLLLKAFGADYHCDFSAEQKIESNPELDELLEDFDSFIIFILSSIPNGTKRSIVEKCLFPKMRYKIGNLIQSGIVSEENGFLIGKMGEFPRISFGLIQIHLPEIIKRYYGGVSSGNEIKRFIGMYYQNVNEDTLSKIAHLHTEYVGKLNELIDNADNKGDIPIFAGVCFDRFT